MYKHRLKRKKKLRQKSNLPRHEKFKQYYLEGPTAGNIKRSGLKAGFGKRYAERIHLSVWFKEFIKKITPRIERKTNLTLMHFIRRLNEIGEDLNTPVRDKIAAYGRAGHLMAMYAKIKSDEKIAELLPKYNLMIQPTDSQTPVKELRTGAKPGGVIDCISNINGGGNGSGH